MQLTEFLGGPVVRTLLSLPGAWVQSLVRKLRSHKPDIVAKKKKKKCSFILACNQQSLKKLVILSSCRPPTPIPQPAPLTPETHF